MANTNPKRVIAYVDGFNLYFGLRDSGMRAHYWLNLQSLAQRLLKPGQQLECTKYFTSRISGSTPGMPPAKATKMNDKRKRQLTYLEALGTLSDFRIYYGHFLAKNVTCFSCADSWATHEEKMTDVNIATEMLTDVYQDKLDTVLLISADSDLVPPVRAILKLFPKKSVVAGFPPGRFSAHLKTAASASFIIGKDKIKKCQFPDKVTKPDGFVLQRPVKWK